MDIYGTNTTVAKYAFGNEKRSGAVALVLDTGWGPDGEVTEFTDSFTLYKERLYDDPARSALTDILKRAKQVYCHRPYGGEYAVSVIGRAKYKGTAGNRITVGIKEADGIFTVSTYVDGVAVDTQAVSEGCRPVDNGYVIFSDAELFSTSGIPFSGGRDAVMTDEDYEACLDSLSEISADVIISNETSAQRIAFFLDLIDRIRCGGGTVRGITSAEVPSPGSPAVTSVIRSGGDGGAVYYIAGLMASLPFYRSAVGEKYDGSFDPGAFDDELTALRAPNNRFVLVRRSGGVYVIRDNNSSDNTELTYNLLTKLKDEILQRINGIFGERYLGRIRADGAGASLLQGDISASLSELYGRYGIFSSAPAVSVSVDNGGTVAVSVTAARLSRAREISISAAAK